MGTKDERSARERLETTTAERLAEIVAAAERAALKVIDDAEREAARQVEEARALAAERLAALGAEVDAVIAQANEIRHRSQELLVSLSRLRTELGPPIAADAGPRPAGDGWVGYGPRVAPRGSHLSAVAPVPEPEPEPPALAPERPAPDPAGARLLATQMAISGSSRQEIAARLRNGFEIDDPEAILEAILGPEG
ncbi:MAG: hypothetical protein U0R71_11700 [Solirubrobacterales bacterium]